MEFPKGVGVQAKKPSMGGVWIFSGTTHSCCSLQAETFHINITIIRTVLSIAEAYSVNIIIILGFIEFQIVLFIATLILF